ncbi:MAG: tripartite tricarboxylate transporter substrate binding protein [Hyphomicrobiales bacterium]|nr:tripartite tricarboxylate transporter substrate binding protein [Hyphomicrobiales bacterium]
MRRFYQTMGIALWLVSALLSDPGGAARAAQDYPARAVRLVVGFAAGGSNDILARVLAERLQGRLGQPVIVENRPGAGGQTAAAYVKNEPPDGYTLLVGASGAMVIAPAVTRTMPYDTLADFAPISLVASFPLVMVVPASSDIKTVKDIVAWTKANPEKANYATASPTFTLATELFKLQTSATMQPIPYRGSNESVASVISGQTITAIVDTLPAMSLLESGRLRGLAITSAARVPELAEVPTMREAGMSDMDILIWTGLFASKGTPRQILSKLEGEVRAIMQDSEVKKRLRAMITDAVGSSSEQFSSTIAADIKRWSAVAKNASIEVK